MAITLVSSYGARRAEARAGRRLAVDWIAVAFFGLILAIGAAALVAPEEAPADPAQHAFAANRGPF